MSEVEKLILNDNFEDHVRKRSKIWNAFDKSANDVTRAGKFASDLGDLAVDTIQNISKTGVPPDEIRFALNKLENEFAEINRFESNIKGYENEIERIERKHRIAVISVVVIILVVGIICYFNFFSG